MNVPFVCTGNAARSTLAEALLGHGFDASDAPRMDLVLTVCDKATGEVCPVWQGQPLSAYWGWTTPPVD